ncbi:MAG: arginine--tRNA ligase [Bacteroidia bacterium]|jgi:arginyl-tRNA synthetase
MKISPQLWFADAIKATLNNLYPGLDDTAIVIQETRKDVEGDFTLVCFGLTRYSQKNPAQTAEEIGVAFCQSYPESKGFSVINGFLNITLHFSYWCAFLESFSPTERQKPSDVQRLLIEYSSPNTNKPLHLGHIRNILLGFSLSRIAEASGKEVVKVNLVNDRGIHICKSMVAWQKFGNGETPESSGIKGDHLVGKYYVLFDKHLQIQTAPILEQIIASDYAKLSPEMASKAKTLVDKLSTADADKSSEIKAELKRMASNASPIMMEAQEMLRQWEAGNTEVISLWKMMNQWVYIGFDETYARLGVDFDRTYYESETYLLGKTLVDEGERNGALYRKDDASIWIDLSDVGLDQKLLLRSDGTSVYMTQDLGTALLRHQDYHANNYVYVVGNEQDYHFKVLRETLLKMGYPWADGIYHLSYGMVDLPSGKMKSREGTVVDADDLMDEVIAEAKAKSEELGKGNEDLPQVLHHQVGMAALKYYILKVDPKKRMVFNPSESIDINGNTGPFIQYTYARIQSVLRKSEAHNVSLNGATIESEPTHNLLIRTIERYHATVNDAAKSYNPSLIANYAFELAKLFNQFYHDFSILKESDIDKKNLRLIIAKKTAETLKHAMFLLGIEMPERM